MIKRVILLFIMILTVSATVNLQGLRAESYQFEVGGSYDNKVWNSFEGEKKSVSIYGINATAYSEQVNTDGRPYMEAAFLQKAGYVTLRGAYGSYIDEGEEVHNNSDNTFAGIDAAYVFSPVPVFVNGGYEYTAIDGEYEEGDGADLDYDYKGKIKSCYGNLGYYITEGFILAGTAGLDEEERTYKISPYSYDLEHKIKSFGGYLKYVTMLNADMGINLEGSYSHFASRQDWEDKDHVNHVFIISGDFYANPKVGIGGSVEFNRGADDELAGNKYTAEISAFVTPEISVTADFGFFDSVEGSSEDIRLADIMLNIRF